MSGIVLLCETIDELDFDFDGILSEAAEELDEDERETIGDELSEAWQRYSADECGDEEAFEHWREAVENIITERIDEVLGELSY